MKEKRSSTAIIPGLRLSVKAPSWLVLVLWLLGYVQAAEASPRPVETEPETYYDKLDKSAKMGYLAAWGEA